jgi:hypothetical protein
MVTADEQRELQLENAEAEARFWSTFRDMNAETVEGHKQLVASSERVIAEGQSAAADAENKAAIARERLERIRRGEEVEGGLRKPLTWEDCERICREAGLTTSDIRHCVQVSRVSDAFGVETMMKALHEARERAERNTVRRLYRRIKQDCP